MSSHHLPAWLARLAKLQSARPWLFVIVAILSLIPSLWAASGLGFRADFAELLPENKESVVELRRASQRLAGVATLTITAEIAGGKSPESLQKFVDEVVPRLHELGPEWVGAVDSGVHDTQKFFSEHALLYANIDDLRKAHEEILDRYDYEVAKASGNLIDDDDPPGELTAESIRERLGAKGIESKATESYPDGYYQSPEGDFIALLIRTPASGKAQTEELKRRVAEVVASVEPQKIHPEMEVRYTGDVITSAEEYDAIVNDLSTVGLWGITGILAVVFLYFLRVRTVLLMGATILVALAWTFGITRYTLGYLNSSSGFLVSIIAGNGINSAIMFMARYIEARRDQGMAVPDAVKVAHRDSWIPTLASAATAMLAYGSLIITDFRGFKHFGIIGSYGMVIAWVATYLFMPAFLAASEQVWPAYRTVKNSNKGKLRTSYGLIFAKLALSKPRLVTVIGGLLGVASIALSVQYFSADPIEYDMTNVRNERRDRTTAGELSSRVDNVVGRIGQDGMAIMTDRVDQVEPLTEALMARYDAAPEDAKPFEQVVSIFSILPKDQDEKLELIEEMHDRLLRARRRGFIQDADWAELEPYLPKGEVHPIGIDDLPEQVARAFTERDGTRGRIVYIAPKTGFSVWDAKYLMRWADSFRTTPLPSGEVIKGSGRAVIFADMIEAISEDAPKAITLSAIGAVVIILIAYGFDKSAFGVFLPWVIGLASLIAFMQLYGMKLNFLNFIALPITTGIGAEYAHNLMQRYRAEEPDQLAHVVVETGGAVALCSLTTTIGYLALLLSINQGIVSFGLASAVGELTCLFAAVIFLPAVLAWRMQRKRAAGTSEGAGEKQVAA